MKDRQSEPERERAFTLEGKSITGVPVYGTAGGSINYVALHLGALLLGVAFYVFRPSDTTRSEIVAGAVLLTTCIQVTSWIASKRRPPVMVINAEGIFDNMPSFGAGMVEWKAIKSAFFITYNEQELLCFRVNDLGDFLQHQDEFGQDFYEESYTNIGAPIAIPLNKLDIDRDDLRNLLDHYRHGIFQDRLEIPV